MSVELRPLSLGEILDGSFTLFRSHLLLFLGIAAFPVAAYLGLFFLGTRVVTVLWTKWPATVAASHINWVFYALTYVIYPLSTSLAMAAVNRAVLAIWVGKSYGIVAAYKQATPNWWRYTRLKAVIILCTWGAPFLIYVILFRDNLLYFKSLSLRSLEKSSGSIVLPVLLVFCVGYWFALRYAFSVPASISENLSVGASLKRSSTLSRKGKGRILALVAMVMAMFYALYYAVLFPFMFLNRSMKSQAWLVYVAASWLSLVVAHSLTLAFYSIAITLLYFDARVRKEGFDIEWMMELANLSGVTGASATLAIEPLPPDVALG